MSTSIVLLNANTRNHLSKTARITVADVISFRENLRKWFCAILKSAIKKNSAAMKTTAEQVYFRTLKQSLLAQNKEKSRAV